MIVPAPVIDLTAERVDIGFSISVVFIGYPQARADGSGFCVPILKRRYVSSDRMRE
jgi:hypothetical protein